MNRMLIQNQRAREAMENQHAQVQLHNNSSALQVARNRSHERKIRLEDECTLVENDKRNKFRHDREALQYKKAQQQLVNDINSQMIMAKQQGRHDIARKNPVQVDSDVALSLINTQLLKEEPPAPVGKVSFII